ncbi:J domain-containing protein [Microbaculum marinisediminis]|uniref:J domain-containing protein n=1 Tax=Microbaculum marinisediminis TaxID=2931392 RepID=A0AAW5QYH0_9HYPH|nr:J domain-containing protein [Microbaculum sp. A6E488]MCT8971458.1 J domain-containing protein [Microbaculum sp. A6E488]
MKLNSKWFDRIRVRPDEERRAAERVPQCEAPGCRQPGGHRAPKGRHKEGEYYNFCIDHVRDYNKSYNWFSGMSESDVQEWLRSRATGHRPTWSMGVDGKGQNAAGKRSAAEAFRAGMYSDPYDFFAEAGRGTPRGDEPSVRKRRIGALERRSLDVLGLDETATGPEIKVRYKELVKRHHPDANGGDRSKEDRLRSIIEAYNTLKASGFYRDS